MGWECKCEGGSSTWTCRDASEKGKRTTPKNTLNFDLCFAIRLQKMLGKNMLHTFAGEYRLVGHHHVGSRKISHILS